MQLLLAEATIVALNQGSINLYELGEEDIVSITINTAQLAYFQEYEADQVLLQPVFVLEGNAELANKQVVATTLYLPAISSNYLIP